MSESGETLRDGVLHRSTLPSPPVARAPRASPHGVRQSCRPLPAPKAGVRPLTWYRRGVGHVPLQLYILGPSAVTGGGVACFMLLTLRELLSLFAACESSAKLDRNFETRL